MKYKPSSVQIVYVILRLYCLDISHHTQDKSTSVYFIPCWEFSKLHFQVQNFKKHTPKFGIKIFFPIPK